MWFVARLKACCDLLHQKSVAIEFRVALLAVLSPVRAASSEQRVPQWLVFLKRM
jgi:hypothetical protein